MPTYSYRCEACGHEFERVQRISEDALKDCPECHQPKAKRQISSGNFILKGRGWYSDLYSGGSNKKKDEASGGDSKPAAGETKSEGAATTDAKPAAAATSSSSTPATATPTSSPPPSTATK